MATDTQIKVRTATALARVLDAAGRLSDRFPGVEAPEIPTRLRYPEMLPLVQLEAIGNFLEAVDHALDGGAEPTEDATDLARMTRADLNEYAAHRGVDSPESMPNKDAVIAAIEATQDADDETDASDEEPS